MPPIAENENDEDPGQDSLVDKVMDELEAVNLDAKSKPVTMPPVPGKPFLERAEERRQSAKRPKQNWSHDGL